MGEMARKADVMGEWGSCMIGLRRGMVTVSADAIGDGVDEVSGITNALVTQLKGVRRGRR